MDGYRAARMLPQTGAGERAWLYGRTFRALLCRCGKGSAQRKRHGFWRGRMECYVKARPGHGRADQKARSDHGSV